MFRGVKVPLPPRTAEELGMEAGQEEYRNSVLHSSVPRITYA